MCVRDCCISISNQCAVCIYIKAKELPRKNNKNINNGQHLHRWIIFGAAPCVSFLFLPFFPLFFCCSCRESAMPGNGDIAGSTFPLSLSLALFFTNLSVRENMHAALQRVMNVKCRGNEVRGFYYLLSPLCRYDGSFDIS